MKATLTVHECAAMPAGMDAVARQGLRTLLRRERQHAAMILTTHYMDEADLLADSIAIMVTGRLACHGPSLSLKASLKSLSLGQQCRKPPAPQPDREACLAEIHEF